MDFNFFKPEFEFVEVLHEGVENGAAALEDEAVHRRLLEELGIHHQHLTHGGRKERRMERARAEMYLKKKGVKLLERKGGKK